MIIGITGFTEDAQGRRGSAGAGKDSVADALVDCEGFAKVALADPIKRFAADLWGWDEERLWGPSASRNAPDERYPLPHKFSFRMVAWAGELRNVCVYCGEESTVGTSSACRYLTARRSLQQIGTEVARRVDQDVWARYAVRTAVEVASGRRWYRRNKGVSQPNRPGGPIAGVVIPDVRFQNEVDEVRKAGGKVVRVKRRVAVLAGEAAAHASEVALLGWLDSRFDYVLENDCPLALLPARAVLMHKVLSS